MVVVVGFTTTEPADKILRLENVAIPLTVAWVAVPDKVPELRAIDIE